MKWMWAVFSFALLIAVYGSPTAKAAVPETATQMHLSFAPVVRQAAPAVVNIYASKLVRTREGAPPFFNDPMFRRFFGNDLFGGVPRERVQRSLGSGVMVSSDGLIMTNYHVIRDAQEITVVLADRRELDAKLIHGDERTDLAVLRVDAAGEVLPFLEFGDSDALEVGDLVLAIGNPFGVGQSVTSGIVSALARTSGGISDYQFFIQTDAAINPGNSGGALVSVEGQLMGINTAIYSRSGGSVGIGFAIPANMAKMVLRIALGESPAQRPWLGASGQPVTTEIADSMGLARPAGVLVNSIWPGGPADQAGLRVGDVILTLGGYEAFDVQALRFRIATQPIGEEVEVGILRGGRQLTRRLPLRPAPEEPLRTITRIEGRHPLNGAIVGNLSPAFAEELGMDSLALGVVIVQIQNGSPVQRFGFRPGDIVRRVGGNKIDQVSDLEAALARPVKSWRIVIERDGKALRIDIGG